MAVPFRALPESSDSSACGDGHDEESGFSPPSILMTFEQVGKHYSILLEYVQCFLRSGMLGTFCKGLHKVCEDEKSECYGGRILMMSSMINCVVNLGSILIKLTVDLVGILISSLIVTCDEI